MKKEKLGIGVIQSKIYDFNTPNEGNNVYENTDEYYDKKSDEEIEKLPLINDEVKFSSLKIDVNNILNEFIKFIKSNEIKLEGLE
jgi:hypothetical protein